MATKYWSGTGTWNQTNTNWATSSGGPYNTTFNAGDDAVFEGTAGTVTVDAPNNPNSITFNVTGYEVTGNTITLTGAGEITVGSTYLADFRSILAGSVGLTKTGAGELRLGPTASTYTGSTRIKNGAISYWNNDNILPTGTTVILGDASTQGTLYLGRPGENRSQQLAGLETTGLGGSVLGAHTDYAILTLALTGGQSYVFGGVLGGPGSNDTSFHLTLSGSGKLTLSGNNTYTGTTTIGNGIIVVVQHANALGSTNRSTTVNSGGQLQVDGSFTMAAEQLSLTGSGADGSGALRVISGNSTGFGNISLPNIATIKCEAGTSLRLDGYIGGGGGITKTGSGTLELMGTGTDGYNKATTINDGTLKLGGVGNSYNTPLGRPTSGADGTFVNSPGVLDLNGWTIRSSEGGEGLTLNGAGTLINSSATAATYPGAITLAGASSIVANNGNIVLSAGINTAGYALTLGGSNAGSSVSSVVSGTGALTKEGTGTWTLSGTNTYTGATTISAGTLLVDGNQSSATGAVSVAANATLGGTGTIGGAVTSTGGILSPGSSSAATLTISKASATALALNSTSVLTYTLGTAQDKIVLSGASSNLTLDGTVNVTAGAGFAAGTYDIITYQGTLTDNTLAVGSMPSGFAATVNIDSGNKKVQLVVTGQAATLFNNRNYMNNYASMGVR